MLGSAPLAAPAVALPVEVERVRGTDADRAVHVPGPVARTAGAVVVEGIGVQAHVRVDGSQLRAGVVVGGGGAVVGGGGGALVTTMVIRLSGRTPAPVPRDCEITVPAGSLASTGT